MTIEKLFPYQYKQINAKRIAIKLKKIAEEIYVKPTCKC